MRIMVVDDEQPARERLKHLLALLPEHTVCGEAGNGVEALQLAQALRPEIILMDIRMPRMDGLEAARHLAQFDAPPAVIFATAYDDHALEAFEAKAVGYLLKPIRQEPLQKALANARVLNRAQLATLRADEEHEMLPRSHICARIGSRLELVPIADVIYFQADQKYVTVRHCNGELVIEESLKALAAELAPRFLRIHRNALIAKAYIAGLEKSAEGHRVILRGVNERLEVSRRHLADVRQWLQS